MGNLVRPGNVLGHAKSVKHSVHNASRATWGTEYQRRMIPLGVDTEVIAPVHQVSVYPANIDTGAVVKARVMRTWPYSKRQLHHVRQCRKFIYVYIYVFIYDMFAYLLVRVNGITFQYCGKPFVTDWYVTFTATIIYRHRQLFRAGR